MTQLIIICGYLLVLLLLGVFANRMFVGTKSDFVLANHSIGPVLLLMSLFGTTMTAFALVGSSGEAFRRGIGVYGMLASSSGIIHSLCFFVVGVKIWSFGRRYGYTTQIQFFRDRLESDAIGLLLFPVLVGLVIPYLLIGVMSAGTVMQSMTAGAFESWGWFPTESRVTNHGIPPWLGSLVICGVVLIYVFFGGMRGTAWANALQTAVFMILGIVTFFVIAQRLGGHESIWENLRELSERVDHDKATRAEISKLRFLTYLLVPFSVGMFPHLFQHWLTAKSARSFKLPVVCHPLFIMIVWVPCVLVGIWATTITLPPTIRPNAVLPFLVKSQTGPVLGGFLAAGILAAIMSSLDSQFLCLGTIFSTDIVEHYVGKDRFSESQQVLIARLFIVAIVGVTYGFSLLEYRSVFGMGVWCFSGFASLFPLVLAALYWRRLTKYGAMASVLATTATWGYLFHASGYGADREFGVAGMEPVVPIFLVSAVTLVVVSLVTPPPSEATIAKFFPDS